MRTMKFLLAVLLLGIFSPITFAKDKKGEKVNWENVDFVNDYKIKFKLASASKSLKETSVFITDYSVNNALRMKGSESNAKGTVHSEVFFGGIPQNKFQAMVEELYQHFQAELTKAGIQLSDGEKEINSEYANKQKENEKNFIGKTGNETYHQKAGIAEGSIPGYAVLFVKEGVSFRPVNKNVYIAGNKIYANFYQKLATQENVNLLNLSYNITFAGFEGSRGYSSARLETQPLLSILPVLTLVNPKGSFSFISIENGPIWGNEGWSLGIKETDLNKLDYFGLATSADYAIEADPDKYIAEVKAIIMNFQTDLVAALKAELD